MKEYTKQTIEFYNEYFKKYIKKGGAIVLKNKINIFIKLLPGHKVLDVGCGPGHDTDYLTKKGSDCLGIDLSEKMINYAKENYKGKFKIMDFFDLKFKENTFDGIWCSSALTHVDKRDLAQLLKNLFVILKRGGVLGIIVPKAQKRSKNKKDTRIFSMFHKYEIEGYLIKNGFKIIKSEIFSSLKEKWIFLISKK